MKIKENPSSLWINDCHHLFSEATTQALFNCVSGNIQIRSGQGIYVGTGH